MSQIGPPPSAPTDVTPTRAESTPGRAGPAGTRRPIGIMSPVLAHAVGSALSMRGRLLALVAITAASLGIFAGGLSAIDSTLSARDQWFAQGALADLEVRFTGVPASAVPDFSSIDGVAATRSRALVQGTVAVDGNSHLSLELVAGQADAEIGINKLTLLSGALLSPDDTDGTLIDWHLADSHGVKAGDSLDVTVDGKDTALTVRGIVRDPEFLLAPANPTLFIPTKDSLGIAFVTDAAMAAIESAAPVNSVLVQLSPGADKNTVRQAILQQAASAHLEQAYALGTDEQFSSLYLAKNLAAFATVVPVIVSVTGLSAVFVTFFLLAQWLARERRALGVFMTLGYTRGTLARAFLAILAVLAAVSMALGVAIAYLLARVFIGQFATSVGIPVAPAKLTATLIWSGCAAIAVVFAAAGLYTAISVSRMTPLDAIRTVPGTTRHPGRVSSWLGSRLPTTWLRMAVRNTTRDKIVSLSTVLAMALGFGITASFFISFSSLITTAHNQVTADTWDAAIDFRVPLTSQQYAQVAQANDVLDATGVVRGAVQASANGVHANLYVGGFDTDKLWYAIKSLLSGQDITRDDPDGVAIEVSTANQLGLKVGDTVELDSTSGHFEAHVVGIFSGALPGEARFTYPFAQQVLALDGLYTGMLIKAPPGQVNAVVDALADDDAVSQVLTRDQISDEITALSDQIASILNVGASVSVVVALLFVMACLGYTVLKRAPDYHLLRALGNRDRTVVATILAETGILGVLAIVLAVPIGAWTAQYTCWRISQAWFHVGAMPTVQAYAQTLLPALVLLPIVALPMARTVSRAPLDDFMRSRELG